MISLVSLFPPYSPPMRKVLLSAPFYRWQSWSVRNHLASPRLNWMQLIERSLLQTQLHIARQPSACWGMGDTSSSHPHLKWQLSWDQMAYWYCNRCVHSTCLSFKEWRLKWEKASKWGSRWAWLEVYAVRNTDGTLKVTGSWYLLSLYLLLACLSWSLAPLSPKFIREYCPNLWTIRKWAINSL